MEPLVSVIINCYNGETFVRETLDSVLAQTYKSFELIFWDNCSTDCTPNIVKECNDVRIKYFRAEKKTSLGQARNLAMGRASGDYIAFIDSDDLWLPDFLAVCVSAFTSRPNTSVAYTRFINFDGVNEWLSPGSSNDRIIPLKELISSYGIGMSGAMFRKSIKDSKDIHFDERFSLIEDFDFFIQLGSCGDVFYISNPQMRYRWNSNGLTLNSKWASEDLLLYEKVKNDARLSKYQKYIRNIYEKNYVRDLLFSSHRLQAIRFICKSVWHNPSIIKYIYPVFLGMKRFHSLRIKVFSNHNN